MLSFWVFVVFNKSSYLYWKLQIPDVCMLSIFPSPTKRFLLSELANACQKKNLFLEMQILETSFLKIAECMLKLPFIYVLDSDDGKREAFPWGANLADLPLIILMLFKRPKRCWEDCLL